jgi:hypothetical protein
MNNRLLLSDAFPSNYTREDGTEVQRFARNFYHENTGFGRISESLTVEQTKAAGHIAVNIICEDVPMEPVHIIGFGDNTITHEDFMEASPQLVEKLAAEIAKTPTYHTI